MLGDGPQCAVRFANESQSFYTNGDTISGHLDLKVLHRTSFVSKITASLICEEWVHTTQLEFKEHFHSNTKMFDVPRNPIELVLAHPASIAFELEVPKDEALKLPPSFDLKHNNVVWKLKFSVEHKAARDAAEAGIVHKEQRIRLCRFSSKLHPNLDDSAVSSYSWLASQNDFTSAAGSGVLDRGEAAVEGFEGALANALRSKHLHSKLKTGVHRHPAPEKPDITGIKVLLRLDVPAYGLVQTPLETGPKLGLRLSLDTEFPGLELCEVALDLVKFVLTVGKDPYDEVKPVIRLREVRPIKPGTTDLTKFLSRVSLKGFTETFKTEWQQLAHKLRITFSFAVNGNAKHIVRLAWAVPVTVLSEAYGV